MVAHRPGHLERIQPAAHPDAGAGDAPPAAASDVAVLVADGAHRSRLADALQHAGYRVAVPREPVAWLRARRSPVLLTDDTDGARRLRDHVLAAAPGTPCVVLVHEPTTARYRQVLAVGATALPDSCADADVVLAVGAAVRSFACVPTTVARALAGCDGERPLISEREAAWLRYLVEGVTVASLARTVGYSQREMYRMLSSLYERLGAANRTEALLRADRWGLLGPGAAKPER